jgi:hypothetical protein
LTGFSVSFVSALGPFELGFPKNPLCMIPMNPWEGYISIPASQKIDKIGIDAVKAMNFVFALLLPEKSCSWA